MFVRSSPVKARLWRVPVSIDKCTYSYSFRFGKNNSFGWVTRSKAAGEAAAWMRGGCARLGSEVEPVGVAQLVAAEPGDDPQGPARRGERGAPAALSAGERRKAQGGGRRRGRQDRCHTPYEVFRFSAPYLCVIAHCPRATTPRPAAHANRRNAKKQRREAAAAAQRRQKKLTP